MSDAAPWEDYAAPATSDDGPWNDYAPKAAASAKAHPTIGGDDTSEGPAGLAETALHMGSGAIGKLGGGLNYLATLAATRGDTDAAKSVQQDTENALTYEPRTDAGKEMTQGLGDLVSPVANYVGKKAGAIEDWTADKFGSGAGAAAKTMIEGAPYVLGGGPEMSMARGAVRGAAEAAPKIAEGIASVGREAPETAVIPPASAAESDAASKSMGAAQVNPNPFALTGQETGRGSLSFPQVKLSKNSGDVSASEQSTRAGIVKEILNDANEDAGIRTGVVTGNEQTLRSEYTAAKNPTQTPANAVLADQISAEQRALPKFAQQRVEATGADPTLTNDYQRGETINNAFYGDGSLKDYLNQQKNKIFQSALEKNGDTQIGTPQLDSLLTDPQFTAGARLLKHEGVVGGASDLANLAKTVGFKDPVTGAQYAPGSVAAWNAVTKALNKSWTPDNAVTIGKVNGAINQDIAASGGGDLYKLGNQVHQLDKSLLSDSPGIKKVFGEVDPNGVQTGKPFDSIPQTLNNMPLDDWRHIHDTLDMLSRGKIRGAPAGMDPIPDGLQQAAANAKAEMHGSLAREVYAQGSNKAGGWNSNSANKALNGRVGQKILDAFPPDEVRKFQVLNAGSEIMPGAHTYEGAGAQTARMGKDAGILEQYAPAAGAFAGAKAGPIGAFAGEKLGQKLSKFSKSQRESAHAKQVSDVLRKNLNLANPGGSPIARATGGKVDHEALVERLISRWKAAKKATDKTSEALLKVPDATITRALKIAQEHI
jgi:DNA-binding transcriptional regulator YdaS (Cro superfamily)